MHDTQFGADDSALITLRELGWNNALAQSFDTRATLGDTPARVTAVHRNRVVVAGEFGERNATLASGFHSADSIERPATGDWVVLRAGSGDDTATVRAVLPRQSAFIRRAAGEKAVPQVVAANVDRVFIVTAVPDDVNERRLERYLAVAWESGATPVVVLTKIDLVEHADEWIAIASAAAPGVDVIAVSSLTDAGIDALDAHLICGSTIALLGSSGVGKSTLLNHLAGRTLMRTGDVRDDGRGRHTTTHRELVRLPNGVLVIDTPGMRELQLWSAESGLAQTFDDIAALSDGCRFADCAHAGEPGCAVVEAIEAGMLDADRLASWRKLSREVARADIQGDALATAAQRNKVKSIHRLARTHHKRKYGE
ncbi:MAG: ribosome small subunit-dependent GTPase A [Gemmatimonadaceae bacterium]